MNKFTFIFLFLLVITLVPLVSAGTFDNCAIYGNCQPSYSNLNVTGLVINWTSLTGEPLWTTNWTAFNSTWSNTTNLSYVPYVGAITNVDIGNNNFTLNKTIKWSDAVGVRDLWWINDVSGDGLKMQYLYNYELANDDWFFINKMDGNDGLPDGGIGFMMTNSTGWNRTILKLDGYSLANFTDYQVATTSGISSGAVYVKSNGSTTNTTTVIITSASGNENATIEFRETDVKRASIEYSGLFSDLNFWSKYADGAEDIMFSCNTRTNACKFPTGNVSMNYNLNVSGTTTLNNLHATGNVTLNRYYAGMWYFNASGPSATFNATYQILAFAHGDNLNGFSFAANTLEVIDTNAAGKFQVIWEAEGTGVNNHIYRGFVFINEAAQNNTVGNAYGMQSNEISMNGLGFITLNQYDNVTLRIADLTSSSTGTEITANLNLVRVGN